MSAGAGGGEGHSQTAWGKGWPWRPFPVGWPGSEAVRGSRAQPPISHQGIPGPQRPLPLRGVQGEVRQAQQEERVQRGAVGDREQPYCQGFWLPGELPTAQEDPIPPNPPNPRREAWPQARDPLGPNKMLRLQEQVSGEPGRSQEQLRGQRGAGGVGVGRGAGC